jgi:hypothetical protein
MKAKYIVTRDAEGKELMFVFDCSIDHDAFAEVAGRIKDQTHGNWRRVMRNTISAGFTDGKHCWGRSESLNIDGRPEDDALLPA